MSIILALLAIKYSMFDIITITMVSILAINKKWISAILLFILLPLAKTLIEIIIGI